MLKPEMDWTIPDETARVAKMAFPKGNLLLTLRDQLGPIFEDPTFARLFPILDQPAECPARLALVTILQFMENLTDRQAAEAVRSHIDWKYVLGLSLTDPGFDYSVLCEFRQRRLEGKAEGLLLEKLLERCAALGLLKGKKIQRTHLQHVASAAAINLFRIFNWLTGERPQETRKSPFLAFAAAQPWLRQQAQYSTLLYKL